MGRTLPLSSACSAPLMTLTWIAAPEDGSASASVTSNTSSMVTRRTWTSPGFVESTHVKRNFPSASATGVSPSAPNLSQRALSSSVPESVPPIVSALAARRSNT